MKKLVKNALRRFGFDLVHYTKPGQLSPAQLESISDLSDQQKRIVQQVRPFTMTSLERVASLLNALDHVIANGIRGDIAECGVWRGGSMMAIALALLAEGDTSRSLYLYDTFKGMPPPTDHDTRYDGLAAKRELEETPRGTGVWCYASLDDVRNNILSTGYPKQKIHLVQGKVEDTIPASLPEKISLLRLDTDWYESTKHELVHLFPRLQPNGVLILDDYGYWQGAKKAVDEYFQGRGSKPYLHRIDCTGRMLIKSSNGSTT